MPNRFAMRALDYRYESDVQNTIDNFMSQNIKYDYLDGNREINLNMTLREAEFLFSANPHVRDMAESGEL